MSWYAWLWPVGAGGTLATSEGKRPDSMTAGRLPPRDSVRATLPGAALDDGLSGATAGVDSPPVTAGGVAITRCCGRVVASAGAVGAAVHLPMPTPVATSSIAAAAAPSQTFVPNLL